VSVRAPENFTFVCTAHVICYPFKVSLTLHKASYVRKVGIISRTVIPTCTASHTPQLNHLEKSVTHRICCWQLLGKLLHRNYSFQCNAKTL